MKRLLALSVLFFATYTPEAHATGTCNADVTVTNHASASTTGSIAYCISSLVAQGGGTVNLARGTYYTQGAIALQDGVNIVGVGRAGSVIAYNGTGAHDILTTSGRTVDNVTLRYFTVRGTNTSGQTGIQLNDSGNTNTSDRITIRNVLVEDCGQYGLYVKGGNGLLITDVIARNNGLSTTSEYNIYLRRVNNVKIENSTVSGSSATGLQITDGEDIVIRNLTADANGYNGVRLSASQYARIVGSHMTSNGENGYDARNDSTQTPTTSDYVCVKTSTITDNGHYGLQTRSVAHYETASNTFSGNVTADENYYLSTAATGVCNAIPRDTSVFPFTL